MFMDEVSGMNITKPNLWCSGVVKGQLSGARKRTLSLLAP